MKSLKIVLPIVFLAGGGLALKALGGRDRTPKKGPATERSVPVETLRVERRDTPFNVLAEGNVMPVQTTALIAQVSGQVLSLSSNLKTGGRFKKGEVMLRIDSRDYAARVTQAEAQVQRAQMEVATAEQRQRVAQAELASSGVGSTTALAQHEPQMRAAQAGLASARAGLRLARLALERTTLRAPYDCFVRKRSVEVGDVVGPGRQLVMVAGTSAYEVTVSMGLDRLKLIQAGGNLGERVVSLTMAGDGDGTVWSGVIDRVEAEVESLGRLARLVVRVDKPMAGDKPLFLGSFVNLKIAGTPLKNVFVVPDRAFNGGKVFVVDGEDRLQRREVTIAHRVPGEAYVTEGLNDGDELVVSRMRNPVSGTKVRRHGEGEPKPAKESVQ